MQENTKTLPVRHNPYLHDLVWELLQKCSPGRLLDIPSGPGYFARQVLSFGFDAVAAEIDSDLHYFEDVTYRTMDMAREFPLESASFDYIVSIEGIEHIENQNLFIRECHRVLKPGGRLFLTTPNVSSLENRFGFLITGYHDNPPKPVRSDRGNIFMEHINLIPFHRLEVFLRLAGFKIETLTTYRRRKGSCFLYPFIYPLAFLRYRSAFKKHFKGKPGEENYREIYRQYLSRTILCGSHIVIVALKKN
ncbi:MAG: class I SAM-dependent methyltransferase [candidate division Zixibacteria bacterium]|nr:class I SAM-dependent methyltransferase [candidate division Zixibacteria bacterium]